MINKLISLAIPMILSGIFLNCNEKKQIGSNNIDEPVQTRSAYIGDGPDQDQHQPNPSLKMRLWQEGIDFYARGNEPSWSVDLDFDHKLTFKQMDGLSFELTAYSIDHTQDANIMRIAGQWASGELIMTISGGPCADTMSGEEFRSAVTVQIKMKDDADFRSLIGCGQYVPDYRLNDIWILASVNGEEMKADRFPGKGVPTFEFHVEEGRVAGHAGCNNLTGSFFRAGLDILHFEPFAMTRMMCPDMEIEDLISRAVAGRRMIYSMDGLKMTLSGFDGTELVFQKVD